MTQTANSASRPFIPDETAAQDALALLHALGGTEDQPPADVRVPISLAQPLRMLAAAIATRHPVAIVTTPSLLTFGEAAAMMDVGHRRFARILTEGGLGVELAASASQAIRCIPLAAVLAHIDRVDAERREALTAMTAMDDDAGVAGDPVEPSGT